MPDSWQDITRRAMVGDWVPLECTRPLLADGKLGDAELRFRPKKLPQAVADEITALQTSVLSKDGNFAKVKEAKAIIDKVKDEKREKFTDAETMLLMQSTPNLPAGMRARIFELAVRNGIGEHNFPDGAGGIVGEGKAFDDLAIKEIAEWGPLCEEITEIVLVYSRPLATRGPGNSAKSSTGSSTSESSPKT